METVEAKEITLSTDEAKEVFKQSVLAATIGQCDDLLFGIGSLTEQEVVSKTIKDTLKIVQDNFYLVSKVMVVDDELVDRPVFTEAIDVLLHELWDQVNT